MEKEAEGGSAESIARLVRVLRTEADSFELVVPGEPRLRLARGEAELLHAQLGLVLGLTPVVQIPDDPEPREWP